MKRLFSTIAGAGLVLAVAGCAGSELNSDGTVTASITIAPATAAAIASASINSIVADFVGGPVDPTQIDSLMVTVTRVDVLPDSALHRCFPPHGDSISGYRPGRPGDGGVDPGCRGEGRGLGPFGPGGFSGEDHPHPPRPDSLVPPNVGWGSRPHHWYSLDVVGNGHIDLLHLPPAGLTLASGTVPAGEYGGARLIITDATIWFNTAIVASDSTTLLPDVGYPVSLPHRPGGMMGIMTNAGFTIPDGGGDVQLLFDPAATIGKVIVVDSGKVLMRPVLHPRH